MKIVDVKTGDIKPYWRNPRNNAGAVEEVKRSIEKYGFNVPLVLDRDGVIIAGHTRYKAMLQIGAKKIPSVYVDMDKKKAKEYRIADNKVSELASWDKDMLKAEMREFDLDDLVPGFSQKEMDAMIGGIDLSDIEMPTMEEFGIDPQDEDKELSPEERADFEKRTQEYNEAKEAALAAQEKALKEQREDMDKRQAAFDKKEAEMNNRFAEHSEGVQSQYVECICPACNEEFSIDFSEIKRRVEVHGLR